MSNNIQAHNLSNNINSPKKPDHHIKPKEAQVSKFKQALQEYEAIILASMLEPIFENKRSDSLTGGGFAEETLDSFLVQEYAKEIVRNNKLNIAKGIKKQLLDKYQDGRK